jgi:hypothetical protein
MLPGRHNHSPTESAAGPSGSSESEVYRRSAADESELWNNWAESDPAKRGRQDRPKRFGRNYDRPSSWPALDVDAYVSADLSGVRERDERGSPHPEADSPSHNPSFVINAEPVVKDRITDKNPSHFFEAVNAWREAVPQESSVAHVQEDPSEKLGVMDDIESPPIEAVIPVDTSLKRRRAERQDELRGGAYRMINGRRMETIGGEAIPEDEMKARWEAYQNTPLPDDEPLIHERMEKWFERTRTSAEAKMARVVQYIKSISRMEKATAGNESQVRQRISEVLQGCSELLSSLNKFSTLSAVATYNIIGSAAESLQTLNERIEPQSRRRVVLGVAAGVAAVGMFTLASRRGLNISDVLGGSEDQVASRPRRTGLNFDVPGEAVPPTDVPVPKSEGGGSLQDALNQNPAATPKEAPLGTYGYPWDWASETFGSDQASLRLHELADKAAQDGHTVVWNNVGTAQEWLQIDNSSATDYVIKTLNNYAA